MRKNNGGTTAGEAPEAATAHRLGRPDLFTAFSLAVAAAAVTLRYGVFRSATSEDAAMLFRYADNVAAGHGIVWNPGEPPVDGATDMLFMLLLGGFKTLGLPSDHSALLVNSLSLIALTVMVFVFSVSRGLDRRLALVASSFILFGPAITYVQAGFAAPTFALAVGACSWLAVRLLERCVASDGWVMGAAITVAGLIRPEGFLVGGFICIAVYVVGGRRILPPLLRTAALVTLAAFAFVAWRYNYFGHPLPNPYYRKGAGQLHWDGFLSAANFILRAAAPILGILLAGTALPRLRRQSVAVLIAVGLSTAMWVFLSDEMNFNNRFQYPVVVLALFMTLPVVSPLWKDVSENRVYITGRTAGSITAAVLLANVWSWSFFRYSHSPSEPWPHAAIARVLSTFRAPHRVVLTTEAGFICWKSGWTCIDAWGLNDARVARDGFLNETDIAALTPDVIVVHALTSPLMTRIAAAREFMPGWAAMSEPLIRYAETSGYVLAATFATHVDRCYAVYVRPDAEARDRLVAALAREEEVPLPRHLGEAHLPTGR